MTAFALQPTGPEVKCDFRGCILNAWHDGDHEFAPKKPQFTADRIHKCEVCGNRFVIYGEHEQPSFPGERRTCGDPACILALAHRDSFPVPLLCRCPQRDYPHELSIHRELRGESYNPKFKFRWPWSLMLSQREEPSTERKIAA